MSENRTLCFISIYFVLSIFSLNAVSAIKSSKSCPIFSNPPRDAYSPINIITKDTIFANVSRPLFVVNGILGTLYVVNTGKALEFYAIPGLYSTRHTLLDGGVLCGQKYRFHKLRIWISQDPNGRSYNEIDGKGSPLTIALYYYNPKYLSFKEALKHPGGVVTVSFMITHGPIPNPLFSVPNIAIRLFRFSGTALPVPLAGLLYAWFDVLPLLQEYYAFWGSYPGLVTGKEYPNVSHIQFAKILPILTEPQLSAFQSLLNENGTKLETVAPLHERTQDVYRGLGLAEGFALI